jgi:uncharacterized protein YecE (DUF72 family)
VGPQPSIAIGTTAWSYDDWRGVFYPERLPSNERLAFYSKRIGTVEVDSTFYHIPDAHIAAHWAEVTPPEFVFSVKLSREITHDRKLRDCDDLLAGFVAALAPLRTKLACVLIQLPPYFEPRRDELALREFVRRLPTDLRWAIEFRDAGWRMPRIVHLLEEHRICWVWNDLTSVEGSTEAAFDFWPHTTDFIYLRLMGDLENKYGPDGATPRHYRRLLWPRDTALENWAEKIRAAMHKTKRAHIYGANHFEGFAPATAARMAERLGMPIALPDAAKLEGGDGRQMELL